MDTAIVSVLKLSLYKTGHLCILRLRSTGTSYLKTYKQRTVVPHYGYIWNSKYIYVIFVIRCKRNAPVWRPCRRRLRPPKKKVFCIMIGHP